MEGWRRIVPIFIGLAGAVLCDYGAVAGPPLPPAPFKPPSVGTWFDYGAWECEVRTSAGFETFCAGAEGSASTYGMFFPIFDEDVDQILGSVAAGQCDAYAAQPKSIGPVSIDDEARNAIEKLWPLEVGNRATFEFSSGWDRAESRLSVDRTETTQIAGKTYSTYVVIQEVRLTAEETTGTRFGVCDLRYRRTIWYDPSSGTVVRDRMRWLDGPDYGQGWDSVLVGVRLPVTKTAEEIAREEARLAKIRAEIGKAEAQRQASLSAKSKSNIPAYINFGTYHALVIGIDEYKYLRPLKTAVADAESVAAVLKDEYGFKVTKLINPTHEEIFDALDELRETLKFQDNLLIYYAGHGWLDERSDQGYWMPSNAKKNRRSRWVSNTAVTDTLTAIESKHVMVVSDSCYSGRLVRSGTIRIENADTPEYLQKMSRKKARVVITSGGFEPVEDGRGKHSPFARAFLKALAENESVIDGTKLFAAIRRPVMISADQTPQYSDIRRAGHDGGEFLFVRR